MKKIFCILVAMLAAAYGLAAQDITTRSRTYGSEVVRLGAAPADAVSAAAFLYSGLPSFTEAGLSWEGRAEERALLGQEGDGLSEGIFRARTLVRLDSLSAVQGGVSYTNGVKRGVIWNSTSDFDLLYPYVMADSLGGDLSREQYAFYGKYARRSGRLHWGVGASFRALHEYRQVDPRPRDITSDLSVTGSVGYAPGSYVLDFSASYRRYHQSQDETFANPKGPNTNVFHLTGLGRHFERLAGTANYTNVSYRGDGFSAALQLLPQAGPGWTARVGYSYLDMVHFLPSQNQAPYEELHTHGLEAGAAYRGASALWRYAVSLRGGYEARRGDEIVIDNGRAGRMLDLGSFTMYKSDRADARLAGAAERTLAAGTLLVQPALTFCAFGSDYAYPHRAMSFFRASGTLDAGWEGPLGDAWLLRGLLGAGYLAGVEDTFSIPDEYTMAALKAFYEGEYAALTDDAFLCGVRLCGECRLPADMMLGAALSWRQAFYRSGPVSGFWSITASIKF